ncbi:S-layer homology domain-containing protein [Alkalibacillus aidingensis]|uniref:S-layer homology domain-containing protein n=1 Tax=Alkalibacillus aidingensis TaxID=2747607 RepID=UPI001660B273|nr:S-layer homology domain-containing protein [Alkalibacillus aidingensis]
MPKLHRKSTWLIGTVAVVFSLLVTVVASAAANDSFTDIDEDTTHYEEINYLYSEEIIGGFPDDTFRPGNNITRIDAAVMVYRALGLEPGDIESLTFEDIPERDTDETKEAVAALSEADIINGYSDEEFGATDQISRGQVAKIIVEAYDIPLDVEDQGFNDIELSSILADYINALAAAGITDGYPSGDFGVNDPIKRGDFSAFLTRAIDPALGQDEEEEEEAPQVISIE